jgi:hypothetical protein
VGPNEWASSSEVVQKYSVPWFRFAGSARHVNDLRTVGLAMKAWIGLPMDRGWWMTWLKRFNTPLWIAVFTSCRLPVCFVEGAPSTCAHGPDKEKSIHTCLFAPNPLELLARKKPKLNWPKRQEALNLCVLLAQPVAPWNCRHFSSTCRREAWLQTTEHQVALNPKSREGWL